MTIKQKFLYILIIIIGAISWGYVALEFIPPSLPVKIEVSKSAQELYGEEIDNAINYLNKSFNKEIISYSEGKSSIQVTLPEESLMYNTFTFFHDKESFAEASIKSRTITIHSKMQKVKSKKFKSLIIAHELLHIILAQNHEDKDKQSLLNNGDVLHEKFINNKSYFENTARELPEYDKKMVEDKHSSYFEK